MVAEDNRIYSQGLSKALEEDPDVLFCGAAANGQEALQLAAAAIPDLVIMDVQMPVMDGIEATRLLLQRQPGVKVLALTMYSHEFLIVDMLEAGAMGYVDKLASEDYLPEAIRTLQKGLHYHCPTTSMRLSRLIAASKARLHLRVADLDEDEKMLIRLLAEEYTTREIAVRLPASESKVERMRKKLQEKLGVKTTAGIVLYGMREGLI